MKYCSRSRALAAQLVDELCSWGGRVRRHLSVAAYRQSPARQIRKLVARSRRGATERPSGRPLRRRSVRFPASRGGHEDLAVRGRAGS